MCARWAGMAAKKFSASSTVRVRTSAVVPHVAGMVHAASRGLPETPATAVKQPSGKTRHSPERAPPPRARTPCPDRLPAARRVRDAANAGKETSGHRHALFNKSSTVPVAPPCKFARSAPRPRRARPSSSRVTPMRASRCAYLPRETRRFAFLPRVTQRAHVAGQSA